jgi:hypothetical protein
MSDIVKAGNQDLGQIVEDMLCSLKNDRMDENNAAGVSTANGSYAALALAYKGSDGMVELTGNPEAPFCYGVGTKEEIYSKITPMGFKNKPELKTDLQIYLDKEASNPAVVQGFAGYPMYIETAGGITYNNTEGKFENVCQIAGFRVAPGGPLVNMLPNGVITTMYSFDSIRNKTFNEPSDPVKAFETIGTRGEMCSQCIRNGHSVSTDATGKAINCSTNGFLYVVLTHILNVKRTPVVTNGVQMKSIQVKGFKPISEYYDEEGNPLSNIVICIKLGRLSLKGGWYGKDNPEFNINGPNQYTGLLKSLYSNPEMQDASKHLTAFYTRHAIDKRKNETSTFGQLHMEHVESKYTNLEAVGLADFNIEAEAVKAKELWKAVKPKVDVQVIPDPVENTPGTVQVIRTETVINGNGVTKSAAPFEESEDDWNSFNFE